MEEVFRAAKERDRVMTDDEILQIVKFVQAEAGHPVPVDTLETWKTEVRKA